MEFTPFKTEHHKSLLEIYSGANVLADFVVKFLEESDMAISALHEGRCVGWAGVFPLHAGVGEAYSYLSKELKAYGKVPGLLLTRRSRQFLDEVTKKKSLHRVQVNVEFGFDAGYRWAEALGFKWEGVMPMYASDKRTFVRYGRLWNH